MEKDNAKFSRKAGDADYEDADTAEAIVVPGHSISVDMSEYSKAAIFVTKNSLKFQQSSVFDCLNVHLY